MINSLKNTKFLVVLIIASAVTLAVISYQYSILSSSQILNLATENARVEAKVQSRYITQGILNKFESVTSNLDIIANTKSIQQQDVPGSTQLLDSLENSTSYFTSAYLWLDKDGKVLWTSLKNKKIIGTDYSYRDYFLKPKNSLKPYFSNTFQTLNGSLILSISYPIFKEQNGTQRTFNGIILAGITVNKIGQIAKEQLVSDYKSNIGLLDRNGVILYSSSSSKFVGKKIFGPEIQAILPQDIKDQFNEFIANSLKGKTGSGDFTEQGNSSTVAYEPVSISGNDFILLYVVTPHDLATNSRQLAEQPRILSLISILAIGIIASLIATLLFVWNKKLNELVEIKTRDLKIANQSLKESNNQLKVLEKTEREFINIAAHELKTPIQSIVLISEEMEGDLQKGTDFINISRDYAEIILRNAKRLSKLTASLLTISKIENRSLHLSKEKINLREKITDIIADIKQFIQEEQSLEIVFKPVGEDVVVEADKNMLFEVISNLLINAIKFTKQGSIIISITTKEGYAIVSIRDTGKGISPEISTKLFEKFTSSENGTGLGLFIVKNIVELHGGKIWFEKNEDGIGTTFSFSLPLEKIN